jgi:hypothetical protein
MTQLGLAVASRELAAGFGSDLAIVGFELGSDAVELRVGGIESIAVVDNFGNVRVELSGCDVLVGAQVVLNGREVHGFLDDLGVVRDPQGDGVHRLPEGPRGAAVLQQVEDAHARTQGLAHVVETVPAIILLRIILFIDRILNFLSIATIVILLAPT